MENSNHWFIGTDELIKATNINNTQKLLLMKINALQNSKGYAFCSNEYLSDLFNLDKATISRSLSKLQQLGYINCKYDDKSYRKIKVKTLLTNMSKGVDENVNGGLTKMSRGLDENVNHNNKVNNKVNNKEEKRNIKENLKLDEKVEVLKIIFKEYYSSIASRFITKKVKEELTKKIKDFDDIKKGLKNYLDEKSGSKTKIEYIKSTHIFIKDEMYKDFLDKDYELEEDDATYITVEQYIKGDY